MSNLSTKGMALRPSAASWRAFLRITSIAALLTFSTCFRADGRLNEAEDESNMFSPPENARQAPPGFSNGPGRRGGRHRGDDTPGWQQIKMIPSLSPQQRAQIQKIYLDARQDAAPLHAQLVALRKQRGQLGGRGQRGGDFPEGRADFGRFRQGAGFHQGGGGGCRRGGGPGAQGQGPEPRFDDVQAMKPPDFQAGIGLALEGQPGPPGAGSGGSPGRRGIGRRPIADPAVRAQLRDLHDRMRSKRQETWQKVQLVLTPQQKTELEQMRRGELMMSGIGSR